MRILFILIVSFQIVNATPEFPNYFKELDYVVHNPESSAHGQNLAQNLIHKALYSILDRIEIPYIDENGKHATKDFFKKLAQIVKDKDPNAKLYIFGGVVRSLIGYIYKKIHNAHLKEIMLKGSPLTREESIQCTKRALTIIIHGISQKDYADYLKDTSKELASVFNKDLSNFSVLGVGSDLDIVYESENPHLFEDDLKAFIEKARNNIKTTKDNEGFVNSFLPKSDVLEYKTQLKRTVKGGGSTFDWFAFEIDNPDAKLLMPEQYPDLLKDFVQGIYHYYRGEERTGRQTVRGLRPLIEIPCLVLDSESQYVLDEDLKALTSVDQEQVDKLVRNARYGGANNRLVEGDEALPVESENVLKIPYFLKRNPIEARVVKNHDLDDLLIPVDQFIKDYTVDGVLLHGTPSLNNMLYMVRNGLFISQTGQGNDEFGPGVYTTKDFSTAKGYAKEKGIVLEFPVKQSQNLRVLNYEEIKDGPKIRGIQGDLSLEDLFKKLVKDYDIDIIINTHVLVQNADILKTPKKAIDYIKSIYKDADLKLRQNVFIEADMQAVFNVLYGEEYEMLLTLLDLGQLSLIRALKEIFIKKLESWLETYPKVSIFIYKNNIQDLKEKAIPQLKGFLSFLFSDAELSLDDFIKLMSDDNPIIRSRDENLTFLRETKKNMRWIAFELMCHMMQKDGAIPYENLNKLLDYGNVYNKVFYSYQGMLGSLAMQRILESDHPTALLEQMIQFQETGDSDSDSLIKVLEIKDLDLRECVLTNCLSVFKRNMNALKKRNWVDLFLELGERADKLIPIANKFIKDIHNDYSTRDKIVCIKNLSTIKDPEDFLLTINPYLEVLAHQKFYIFLALVENKDHLTEILKKIDYIFPPHKNSLGELFEMINKKEGNFQHLNQYLDFLEYFVVNKTDKNFWSTDLINEILKYPNPIELAKELSWIITILKEENSNNLYMALILEALSKDDSIRAQQLEKLKKLIDIIPLKKYLKHMMTKFLELQDLNKMDDAIKKVQDHLNRVPEDERVEFKGQDAHKIIKELTFF